MIQLLFMTPAPGQEGPGMMSNIFFFAAIIAIFYFMIIRPQQKRQKERDRLMSSLSKGDKIITSGGIHGTIVGLEEKTALVQISDNVKVKIDRQAIATVVHESTQPAEKK
jgi:preprotein translocase subunit YajC